MKPLAISLREALTDRPARLSTARLERTCDLILFGSRLEPGGARPSPVECFMRPGRVACPGTFDVHRREVPPVIGARCSDCGQEVLIQDWAESGYDLRSEARSTTARRHEFPLDPLDHKLLRELCREDPVTAAMVHDCTVSQHRDRVYLLLHALECLRLLAFIGAAASELSLERQVHLARVVDKLHPPEDFSEADLEGLDPQEFAEFITDPHVLRYSPLGEPETKPANPRTGSHTYQLKITLRHCTPPIWRRVLVPGELDLDDLHKVIQTAMGWTDSHLHGFRKGQRVFMCPEFEGDLDDEDTFIGLDEVCPEVGDRLDYDYDFGDGWEHEILVEKITAQPWAPPRCLDGARACPPEDCGGPPGYQRLVSVLEGLEDAAEEFEFEPDFNPECFDLQVTNANLVMLDLD